MIAPKTDNPTELKIKEFQNPIHLRYFDDPLDLVKKVCEKDGKFSFEIKTKKDHRLDSFHFQKTMWFDAEDTIIIYF